MADRAFPVFRHWRQRFEPNARFIWRRRINWNGEWTTPGEPIPDDLANNPKKLRVLWDTHRIEIAQWDEEVEAEPVGESAADDAPITEPEADDDPPSDEPEADDTPPVEPEVDDDPPSEAAPPPKVERNGNWYTITLQDGTIEKVLGRAKLEARLQELAGSQGS